MPVFIGGAELNVARALARWKQPVKYGTALPDHYLSREIAKELELEGVDTSGIHYSGSRIGCYFLPQGADLKNAGVIFDRAFSSFSELKTGMVDWDHLLDDCSWFHFSAISPALNKNTAALCGEALESARKKGLRISVDLNYRSLLWKYGMKPTEIMPQLADYCDVVMGNIWSAETLIGIESPLKDSTGKTKAELMAAAFESSQNLRRQFTNAGVIAYTFRLEKEYWAVLNEGAEIKSSPVFPMTDIVDKAGSGDCFMAGLIYGLSNNHPLQSIVDFSAAAAKGKLYEKGDATHQSIADVKKILLNNPVQF